MLSRSYVNEACMNSSSIIMQQVKLDHVRGSYGIQSE